MIKIEFIIFLSIELTAAGHHPVQSFACPNLSKLTAKHVHSLALHYALITEKQIFLVLQILYVNMIQYVSDIDTPT